jgi:hypothetical protein
MIMKRVLLSILLVAVGLSVFSQPATRILNMRPAYPLAVGETTVDSLVYAHNGLILQDIVQDSLPIYEIGHIFAQTVRFTEEGHGFYIKADSLHSNQVTYSYQTDTLPRGPIEFNSTTGRFIFYPLASDYKTFVVRFMAVSGNDTVWEDVEFNLRPIVVPESFAFQSQGTMPDGMDYITIAETSTFMFLNNENRTAYSYSISGKDIVFDNAIHNKVWGLSGREDIYEMNLYAERLIIRSEIVFPQTNLTIYAKEIIFEDQGGEMASINVTPIPFNTLTNGQGSNGANAGNISLYVKELHGNMGKRLILNGAKGQSSNRNGVPGNGGNGGTVTSTIDIQNYCDFARGGGGIKFDVTSDGSTETGAIIGAGAIGTSGHFEYLNEPYAYLHPYYISAVLRYVNDAFINNYTDYVFQTCKAYNAEINEYLNALDCDTCYTENEIEFQNDLVEIHSILFKIEQGLDYFGNPASWVPLLSFEVMLANYDNEIDRAVPTLYMYYWLSRIDNSLQQKVVAAQVSTNITEQELASNEALINTLVLEIPILENKAIEITEMIDSVKQRIEILRDQLMAKARHNVRKRNHILKAVGICKAVANVLPVFGPVGVAISTGVNTVLSSSITSDVLSYLAGDEINYSSTLQLIGSVSCDTNFFSNLSSALSDANDAIGGDFSALKSAYKSASSAIKPLLTNINSVSKLLSTSSAPANEVEAEFNKIAAESAEWKSLEATFNELNQKKNELLLRVSQNLMSMTSTLADVSNDVIALDVFRRDAFTGNSKRDLNAMQYLEKMEQRAKNRLLKYHYYLRKAYEYRLLRPYEGEFNLVGMFERFETLGLALDSIVDPTAYTSLKSVFREVVSEIAEEVIDEYSSNTPEQSAPITIVIPHDQLDVLNADGTLTLNFYEMGIFSPDEENVRIVNLSVEHLGSHVNGNIGYSGYMDLNMTHQGISRFRKNGQIYWFDHISRRTTSPHTWGTRYDAITQTYTPIQPSYASSSLLYSLLNNNNSNMMLFSRPSAWGDINVTKKVHTSGGADIVIDSLVLRLQYDFTHRPADIRNIDITTSDGLLPYIACSTADRNGRSNGNGNLNRSYNVSYQTVTFSAIKKYGTWHFVNWTDRAGNIVSDTMDLTVNRLTDQFYRANYERRVPILSVPDTIFVNITGGVYSVPVANVGSGDIEMDWYVSDSLSTWVHLNGLAEGFDDGNFSFTYEDNETGAYRLDSIEIFAPETDIMSKMIYIVQTVTPGCNLTASVTPTSVTICEGEEATVTASGQSSLGNQFSYSWNTGETTPTISVHTGGEHIVTVSDSNGCTATASVNVTVNPLPTITIGGNTTVCAGSSTTLTASGANTYSWSTGDNTASVNIDAFGVYTVTGTSSEGCSNTASVTVLVSQLPVITITGETDICAGESTTLTANGGETYLWSDGTTGNTLTVSTAGTYQVIGYNAAGCNAMAGATVNVWQPATSEFSITTPDSCYFWNSQSYCTSGDYTQTLQTVHGCDSVVTLHLTITVGIDDHNLGAAMTIYPNPTSGVVNVEYTTDNVEMGAVEFQLFDAFGRLLRTTDGVATFHETSLQTDTHGSSVQTQIDLSLYAAGVYFIKAVADGNVIAVRKLIKN